MTQPVNTPERQLRELILGQYHSVRAFCTLFNLPYSTMDNVLRRGIGSVNLSTAAQICASLRLDLAAFGNGRIAEDLSHHPGVEQEQALLESYRRLDDSGRELVELVAAKERERCDASRVLPLPHRGGAGWQQYVGAPIACRGGGVTVATEEDARQMERIYNRLLTDSRGDRR